MMLNKIIYSILLFFICGLLAELSAQVLPSPLAIDGGPDSHVFKTDTIILENAYLDEGPAYSNTDTVITGISMLHSPYLSMFYIPVKYSITNRISMGFSLPFMSKKVTDGLNYSKVGYGDIQLYLSYYYPTTSFIAQIYLRTTLPTGDAMASDRGYVLPMGYGNYTFSGLLSLSSHRFGQSLPTVIFVNVGLIYYTETERDQDVNIRYEYESNYLISSLFGFKMRLFNRMYFNLKGNIIYMPESRYQYTNITAGTSGSWTDLNDSMTSFDIITGIQYNLSMDTSGRMMVIYPVYEMVDDDISSPSERNWKMFMSIEKRFGYNNSAPRTKKLKK